MKLLHVFDTIDPQSGGPIEAVLREAYVLRDQSIYSEIVTLDEPGGAGQDLAPLPVYALGYQKSGVGMLLGETFRYSPQLVPWLRSRAKAYDGIIAHGVWCYNTLGVARALKGTGTPYSVYVHGMMDPWFRRAYPLKHIKKQIYWSLALGRALAGAERVVFTADDELHGAVGSFFGYQNYNSVVVEMGTADAPAVTSLQLKSFQEAVLALTDRQYILFLGRIHPKKGCDLLIRAFARVAADHPALDLVIAGPDTVGWRPTLQELALNLGIADRIHWPGMLTGEAKWGAFYGAKAFILPSHQENFGIAVAEALACGLPVLITPRINIWREVQGAGAGIVAEDNLEGTYATIADFLALSAEERIAMGQRARALFASKFDIRHTALGMINLMRQRSGESGLSGFREEPAMFD